MLEAKDQGHRRTCSPKKSPFNKFFWRSPKKIKVVFKKMLQAISKILTIQKIVLSSSRGQGNYRGRETSRPRPRPSTSKCVLEAKDFSRTLPLVIMRLNTVTYTSYWRVNCQLFFQNPEVRWMDVICSVYILKPRGTPAALSQHTFWETLF